mmetsp:Transcript_21054/g.45871  ORF Transcript_21054/g.45871 Transcript_21054/m.45871 type:complete len:230 (+) Transcript_21054:320-1009(+)
MEPRGRALGWTARVLGRLPQRLGEAFAPPLRGRESVLVMAHLAMGGCAITWSQKSAPTCAAGRHLAAGSRETGRCPSVPGVEKLDSGRAGPPKPHKGPGEAEVEERCICRAVDGSERPAVHCRDLFPVGTGRLGSGRRALGQGTPQPTLYSAQRRLWAVRARRRTRCIGPGLQGVGEAYGYRSHLIAPSRFSANPCGDYTARAGRVRPCLLFDVGLKDDAKGSTNCHED